MDELMKAVKEMREMVEKKFQDCITKDQIDKISSDIQAKLRPEQRIVLPTPETPEELAARAQEFKFSGRMQPEIKWVSEYGKKFGNMAGFLQAMSDMRKGIQSELAQSVKAVMIEGTGSLGGVLVPTEFNNEVIKLLYSESIIFKIARVIPMSTWKRTFPIQSGGVTCYWPGEAQTKTASNPTFTTSLTQTAKVCACIIKSSDELLRDSAINLTQFLAEIVVNAMAQEFDKLAFVGDVSGLTDPFNGVLYASGAHVATMAGASMDYDDIIELYYTLTAPYRKNAIFVIPSVIEKQMIKLKDKNGNYIWNKPEMGKPATINNRPYEVSDNMLATYGTGAQSPILFGDFKQFLYVSPRDSMAVKLSQDAYDAGDTTNAFLQDQTWLRFTRGISIDVARGASFAYLLV